MRARLSVQPVAPVATAQRSDIAAVPRARARECVDPRLPPRGSGAAEIASAAKGGGAAFVRLPHRALREHTGVFDRFFFQRCFFFPPIYHTGRFSAKMRNIQGVFGRDLARSLPKRKNAFDFSITLIAVDVEQKRSLKNDRTLVRDQRSFTVIPF